MMPRSVTGELAPTLVSVTVPAGATVGEAEIEKLGAGFGEHDVAGFQIAMDDAAAVSFVERVGDFRANF